MVHFLWRPFLSDQKDDMVLEAAVNGQCVKQRAAKGSRRDFEDMMARVPDVPPDSGDEI